MSTRGASLVAVLLTLAACRSSADSATAVASPVDAVDRGAASEAAEEPEPAAEEPSLRVMIRPRLEPRAEVEVAVELFGGPGEPDPTLLEWSLAGPIAGSFTARIVDREGEVPHRIEAGEAGVRVVLERPPIVPLRIEYSLAPAVAGLGELARVELDDAHLFATGEALLLLPEGALEQRRRLLIELDPEAFEPASTPGDSPESESPTGLPPLRAASSFAAEAEAELDGWPFELRRAAFVMGNVEWARFDSVGGEDRWLGVGSTRFDHRWSAAELAGVRTAVDARIGLPTVEPMVTILVSGVRAVGEPAFRAELRGRGLVIAADESAIWGVRARMSMTQALLARWLGGRVRVLIEPEAAHPQQNELWFTAGVTRFIARELLYELGLLGDEEYIAELDQIELELASSPLRDRNLTELAAIAAVEPRAAEGVELLAAAAARALLTARGAAYMAWLDSRMRAEDPWASGAVEAVRMVVAMAISGGHREVPIQRFLHRAASMIAYADPPDAELAAAFEAVVIAGRRPELPRDAYGPCFRPRTRSIRRFELGFIDSSRPTDPRPSFTALDPEGPAARAGLRPDDTLVSLDYAPGDASQEVELTVERDGQTLALRYQPSGPKLRAVQWQRVAGVPAAQCVD